MIINNSLHAYYIILLHRDLNADVYKVCIIVYSYTNDLHVCCTTMIDHPTAYLKPPEKKNMYTIV